MLLTEMTMEQVTYLEGLFAQLTETGWVIPEWLVYLKGVVHMRDYRAGLTY